MDRQRISFLLLHLVLLHSAASDIKDSTTCPEHTVEVAPKVCLPLVSLGTGSGMYFHNANVTKILTEWFDVGGQAVDTALIYNNQGQVGQSLRPNIFVTTKIPCTSYKTAKKNIYLCLKLLRLRVVDLMLIHSPRCFLGGTLRETWRALEEVYEEGRIRAIGVSNFRERDFEVKKSEVSVS